MSNSNATRAAELMSAARISLLLGNPNPQPFFGSLAMSLGLVASTRNGTAWVNATQIGFNPDFVIRLTHGERVTLVAHEVLHPALGHPWRRGERDHDGWNIACDKAINRLLLDSGFKLPAGAYIAEGDEIGKSAEWIYAHDLEQKSKQPEPQPGEGDEQPQGGESEESEAGDEESEPEAGEDEGDAGEDETEGDGEGDGEGTGEDEGDGTGQGDGDGGEPSDGEGDGTGGAGDEGDDSNPFGEVLDADEGGTAEAEAEGEPLSEEDWKQKAAQAAAIAKGQGLLPAGMARAIEDALEPQVDVRSLLIKFFQERAPNDYTWTRPSRRYAPQGLYLPALRNTSLGEVAIMVDTSGSVDAIALREARTIVESVLDECKPAGVELVFADAEVNHTQRMEQGEPLTWEPQGGGGTDFRPALAYIDEGQYVCAVCITDLYGTFPEVEPNVPVLWLSTTRRKVAPFGETVYVGL